MATEPWPASTSSRTASISRCACGGSASPVSGMLSVMVSAVEGAAAPAGDAADRGDRPDPNRRRVARARRQGGDRHEASRVEEWKRRTQNGRMHLMHA